MVVGIFYAQFPVLPKEELAREGYEAGGVLLFGVCLKF